MALSISDTSVMCSLKSERVHRIASLANDKIRKRTNRCIIEGIQAVREALIWRSDALLDIYIQVNTHDRSVNNSADIYKYINQTLHSIVDLAQDKHVYLHFTNTEVMHKLSPNAQGVVAVADLALLEHSNIVKSDNNMLVAAFWQIRDPGNAGTVIRTADAAGAHAVILVDDCVDIYNPKVIRATAGSLFHIPICTMSTEEFFTWCDQRQLLTIAADIYGTEQHPAELLPSLISQQLLSDPSSLAILFGNEARGLPSDVIQRVHHVAAIPMYGKAESLNLSASAAVILFTLVMSGCIDDISNNRVYVESS